MLFFLSLSSFVSFLTIFLTTLFGKLITKYGSVLLTSQSSDHYFFFKLFTERTIVSKALREPKEKPPPYPYLDKPFGFWSQVTDRTTPRLDENSKLIVVEGAHAIGKTKFAKELAEAFDMKYMGPVSHDDIYIGPYNTDYRKWNDLYPDWYKCFDEKDFFRNPMGDYEGTCDRYHHRIYKMKWVNQLRAQQHILNTGQGVVMEGCANSDPAYFNAAYQAGWIQDESKIFFKT